MSGLTDGECHRKSLWRRTVFDLLVWVRARPNKWKQREECLEKAAAQLEGEVLESKRNPEKSRREEDKYRDHEAYQERLARTIAFGQWAHPLGDDEDQADAQYGLFGTCAALQVMSKSASAEGLTETQPPGEHEWAREYLRTVNFIDMVVTIRKDGEPSVPVAAELGVTLRACHAARSLAAAKPVLDRLDRHRESIAQLDGGAEVLEDLRGDLSAVAPRNTKLIMDLLVRSYVPARYVSSSAYKPQNASVELCAFTSMPEDLPKDIQVDLPDNIDDWVFLFGSVLVALVRCWDAGLITDVQLVEKICPHLAFNEFKNTIRNPPDGEEERLDNRLRLFGLWALSHLDIETPNGPLKDRQSPAEKLGLAWHQEDDAKWLKKEVEDVCGALLASDIGLADSYSPYTFRLVPTESEYKDDSIIVPVVPLLLALAARYVPRNLARAKVLALIHSCIDQSARPSGYLARPHQLSTRDGVVNLSYYQEAFREVALAAGDLSGSFGKRFMAQQWALRRDWGRWATFWGVVLGAAAAYTLWAIHDSEAAGFVYGVLASALAAAVFHPVILWLWGDW